MASNSYVHRYLCKNNCSSMILSHFYSVEFLMGTEELGGFNSSPTIVSSADNFCKQFGPISGRTKCQA